MQRIIILLFLVGFAFTSTAQTAEDEVRSAFEKYKDAIMNDEGETAVALVDSRTVNYYNDMLDQALTADSATVSQLELLDKLMVLMLRHRTPKKTLASFDGKQLLIFAIEEGMVGKQTVMNNVIGDVVIDGNLAKGQVVINGQASPFYMEFQKEEGQWKVDLTSAFPAARYGFSQMVKESGMKENEYIIELLGMITGTKPGNEIWHPM